MKFVSHSIEIDAPAKVVFDFVTDPANTPKWIDFITQEAITTDEGLALGAVYSNDFGEVEIVQLRVGEYFAMKSLHDPYQVVYNISQDNGITTMTYIEYMLDGSDLAEPFEMKHLEKLKEIIETTIENYPSEN